MAGGSADAATPDRCPALDRLLHPVDPQAALVRGYRRWGKRGLDLVLGTVLVAATLPLMALLAALVLCTLGRPVLYAQPRLGAGARPFVMLKFRSMRHDRRRATLPRTGAERRSGLPSPADPRHTAVGRALRRWSLDELPQLLQVLQGRLSLVGPRPELLDRHGVYTASERTRFDVRPGLTGAWQVLARHDSNDLHAGVAIDVAYVERCSLGNDLRILLRTPWAMLRRPAPY